MLYKRCSRCGKRIPSGTKCPCLKNRHKEYDRFNRDQRARGYYNSIEWQKVRAAALEADQMIDVWLYMTEGKIVKADTVHHIIPLRDDWEKRNELANLMSLSHESHSLIETEYKKDKASMESRLSLMLKEYRGLASLGGI